MPMMPLLMNDEVQQCTLNELASLLSLLSNDEANRILYQSAVEMANSPKVEATCTERPRSLSEGSFAGSANRDTPLWEMQAPSNPYNLAGLLALLDNYDEALIITVRKIHRLGFKSARALRMHFQKFGPVEKVLLLSSKPKTSDPEMKPRPASMGFVVMGSTDAAAACLGTTHSIQGWQIYAQKFVRRDNTQDCSDC